MKEQIDFVILWVDGNDPVWLKEKEQYISYDRHQERDGVNRFRDWNNLQYWFRAVEKYADWVHKIFFITYGHLPAFLDPSNPKLRIVKHSEFIPAEYLPTYNSNVIELNLHRIADLSEHFVYFNDDMFLGRKLPSTYFFRKGKPCEEAVEGLIIPYGKNDSYYHILLNNMDVLNRHFRKREVYRRHFLKWFYPGYGKKMIQNILLQPWRSFTGIKNAHLPVSMCKSTLEKIWKAEPLLLKQTSSHKFRSIYDVNQYLIRYWQLAEGNFVPRNCKGQYYEIKNENYNDVLNEISNQKHIMYCINDVNSNFNFEECSKRIIEAFEQRFPEKSSFEK